MALYTDAEVLARCSVIVSTDHLRLPAIPPRRQAGLVRFLSSFMNAHIAVSGSVKQFLVETLKFRPEKISIIPNWVDPEVFSGGADRAQVRKDLAIAPEAVVVGCVARFHEQKGHQDLVIAADALVHRYPDLLFVLIGEGPTRECVEEQVRALNLASHFLFLGQRDDVATLLAAIDVFVLPSHYEGFPVTVLEAMASRKAVVATAADGTVEAVEAGKTGILVPPGDVAALRNGLDLIIRRPELRASMGAAGRERVLRHFSARPLVRETEARYQENGS